MRISEFLAHIASDAGPMDAMDKCTICGDLAKVGGIWQGRGGDLVICAGCVFEPQALAAALADALVDTDADLSQVNDVLARFEYHFWRALALGMLARRGGVRDGTTAKLIAAIERAGSDDR